MSNRIKEPKELIDKALAKDDVERIHEMYDEDAFRFDMDRKYQFERTDR